MGILDTFKKLTSPYDDEDELDYEDEGGEYAPEAEAAPSPQAAPQREAKRPQSFAASYAEFERATAPSPAMSAAMSGGGMSGGVRQRDNKVVNIHATTQLKVVLVKPERFETAAEIADHLRDKRTVVMNLEQTNKDVARRLIDFLSGVAYAQEGKIKKVAVNTYIITPYNVDIMGDLIDELENNGLYF